MGTLWQDLWHGLRLLRKSPGFAAAVLLIFGLGIGVNTALFNALDQVYARPLPVRKPHELVVVQFHYRAPDGSFEAIDGVFNYRTYGAYRDQAETFAGLTAFGLETLTLRAEDAVRKVQGMPVSVNYFSTLGVRPVLGRVFTPEQEQVDVAHPVVVISYGLWRRQFGGRADVIGRQVLIEDRPLTVVGVMPPGFTGTAVGQVADVYLPLGTAAQMRGLDLHDTKLGTWLYLLGRLKPGIGREQAQAALRVVATRLEQREPGSTHAEVLVSDGSQGFVLSSARVAFYPLALFLGMAVLVLAIACANMANLQLARGMTRHREMAIRRALGAGRWCILRQLLIENMILAVAAGVCGIILAACLNRGLYAALGRITSVPLAPGLPLRALLFALTVSVATGIAFGLMPALHLARGDIVSVLKKSTGLVDLPGQHRRSHNLLVVGQIAVSLVVMVYSGLCLRSLIGLHRIDPGCDPARLLVVRLDLEGWLLNRPDLRRFMEELQERVNRLPDVIATSLTGLAPLSESSPMCGVARIEGFEEPPGKEVSWHQAVVSPQYFETLGQALLAGRDFTVHDSADAPKVLIVNEVLAQRYWPNQNPLGRHVTFRKGNKISDTREVVGIVKTAKLRSITEVPEPICYVPLAQDPWGFTPMLLARVAENPRVLVSSIRREAAVTGAPAACDIRTLAERVSWLLLPQRIMTGILNGFGLAGLALSATGIYSVIAYAVRQRTREIGIRMALGARTRDVLLMVLWRGILLLIAGLALGLAFSLAGTRLLAHRLPQIREWDKFFLYGVYTWDAATYVMAALVISAVALTACYIPARRATWIDPTVALRCE